MSYEQYEHAFETHECFWYLKLGSMTGSQNVSMLIVSHAKERPPYILIKEGESLSLTFMLE